MEYFKECHITGKAGEYTLSSDMGEIIQALELYSCYDVASIFDKIATQCNSYFNHESSCCYYFFTKKNNAKKFIRMFNNHLTEYLHNKDAHIRINIRSKKHIEFDFLCGTFDEIRKNLNEVEYDHSYSCNLEIAYDYNYNDDEREFYILYDRLENDQEFKDRIDEEKYQIKSRATKKLNEEKNKKEQLKRTKENRAVKIKDLEKNIKSQLKDLEKLKGEINEQ